MGRQPGADDELAKRTTFPSVYQAQGRATREIRAVEQRFSDLIKKERERLQREREEIFKRQRELRNKLAEITRELAAVDGYETAKIGKKSAGAKRRGAGEGRRGSQRSALRLIGNNRTG